MNTTIKMVAALVVSMTLALGSLIGVPAMNSPVFADDNEAIVVNTGDADASADGGDGGDGGDAKDGDGGDGGDGGIAVASIKQSVVQTNNDDDDDGKDNDDDDGKDNDDDDGKDNDDDDGKDGDGNGGGCSEEPKNDNPNFNELVTRGASESTGNPHTCEQQTGNPHDDPDNPQEGNPHNR